MVIDGIGLVDFNDVNSKDVLASITYIMRHEPSKMVVNDFTYWEGFVEKCLLPSLR